MSRGVGAIKGWKTRRYNKRVRDKQITDALLAARKALKSYQLWPDEGHVKELQLIDQALWRFGIK
jgi:hypothetical protein